MFEPVLQSEPIPLRLWHEFGFAVREFRDDPADFIRASFSDERQKESKRTLLLATTFTLFFYSIFLALIVLLGVSRVIPQPGKDVEVLTYVDPAATNYIPKTSSNRGGNGAGDSGGGQKAPTTASNGQPPTTSPVAPIVHPDPRSSAVKHPDLPVAQTIQDQSAPVTTQNSEIPVGLQTAPIGAAPSPGTGKGGGLGNGDGPGVGDGSGPGSKPGGKPGGGGTGPGAGGPGGVVGNDPNGPRNGAGVKNSPVRVYYKPEPKYTLDALKNKIVGQVTVFVRANADGTISNPRVLSPLGYGLDEEAVRVAMLVKFYPKIENGRPVSDTLSLIFTFRGR